MSLIELIIKNLEMRKRAILYIMLSISLSACGGGETGQTSSSIVRQPNNSIGIGAASPVSSSVTSATLSWVAPTLNTDETILDDLAGYILHYGTETKNYTYHIDLGNITHHTVNNLTAGKAYYFAVSAYDTNRNESLLSNEEVKL